MSKVEYVLADTTVDDVLRNGFVETYRDAFGGPPYYEEYAPDEVIKETLDPHLKNGHVVLALRERTVIGFACAIPVLQAPAYVHSFLKTQSAARLTPDTIPKVWYISELGVRSGHRRRGIAYELTQAQMAAMVSSGGRNYLVRTAVEGSNSLHLYRKIGSTEIGLQDVSGSCQVTVNQSQSTQRVYLHGSCAAAHEMLRNR